MKYITYSLITLAIIVGLAYIYFRPDACALTQTYYVAQLDPEFGISESQLVNALTRAELIWEQSTFLNLFEYSPDYRGDIAVRLIFDERQSNTQLEQQSRNNLGKQELKIDSNTALYDNLVNQLEEKERIYQINSEKYSSNPNQSDLESLRRQENEINSLVRRINSLVSKIESNVETYNSNADKYNESFSGNREFDQGHYDSTGEIVIYQYDDINDLVLVLAHELGHAVGMGHVQSPKAIMNAFLTHQDTERLETTNEDLYEFASVCKSFIQ